MNKIYLTGRLTGDVEKIERSDGEHFYKGSIAVNSGARDQDGKYAKTDFFNFTVQGSENDHHEEWMKKGVNVNMNGAIHQREWLDQEGEAFKSASINTFQTEKAYKYAPHMKGIEVSGNIMESHMVTNKETGKSFISATVGSNYGEKNADGKYTKQDIFQVALPATDEHKELLVGDFIKVYGNPSQPVLNEKDGKKYLNLNISGQKAEKIEVGGKKPQQEQMIEEDVPF